MANVNISDAQNAYLYAKAMFEEWKIEFETLWYQPEIETMTLMLYNTLTPEQKEMFKQLHPKEAETIEKLMGE